MNEIKKETIDPVEFLAVYQKMQQLSPNALERVNGFIEGISAGFDIAVNHQEQKGA